MMHIIFDLVLFLFYAFIFFIVINHLFVFGFLYVEYNLGALQSSQDYPKVSVWRYLSNCAVEFVYLCGKFYLYPFKFKNLTSNQESLLNNPNPTVILLVHGYARNQTDWMWFQKQLKDLLCPIYTVNLEPALGSIEKITEQSLQPKIAEIFEATSCKEIILIAHSMGSLVSSYYSEYLDQQNLVQRVITIGAPFHGTKISVAAAGANAEQMYPWAKFTDELRAKLSNSQKQYFNIASRFDNIIFPWSSALLESVATERQLILPFAPHLGMLHSSEVVNQVKEWVNLSKT